MTSVSILLSRLVDCFLVTSPVSSLAFSPRSEFMASTHFDDLGVYLWSNKTLYIHVSLPALPSDYQPKLIELPSTTLSSEGLCNVYETIL